MVGRMTVWSALREALRGTRIDYTTAPIGRAVIMLAVPMVVEMAMESITLFVFWLWEIPLAWWLARHTALGARGVFIALTVAYSSLAVVSVVLFRRGTWKMKKI